MFCWIQVEILLCIHKIYYEGKAPCLHFKRILRLLTLCLSGIVETELHISDQKECVFCYKCKQIMAWACILDLQIKLLFPCYYIPSITALTSNSFVLSNVNKLQHTGLGRVRYTFIFMIVPAIYAPCCISYNQTVLMRILLSHFDREKKLVLLAEAVLRNTCIRVRQKSKWLENLHKNIYKLWVCWQGETGCADRVRHETWTK
jgi:hypothetical protein